MGWHMELQIEPGDFVFARVWTETIDVEAMFYADLHRELAILRRVDIQGAGPNTLGVKGLRDLARWIMEFLDVDELRIEGATRASGAGPGRRPAPLVFRRPSHFGIA